MAAGQPWILVCVGMNLILVQYWIMKEYLLVLASSEVSVLLAAISFFASCSLGYLLAPRRFGPVVPWLCLVLFCVHLLTPWLFKAVAAMFYEQELPHITPVMMGLGILVVAPVYTMLLPVLINARENVEDRCSGKTVTQCYGIELGGALAGIMAVLTVGRNSMLPLLVLYFLNFSLILAYVFGTARILYLAVPVSLLYGFLYVPLERTATEDFYRAWGFGQNLRLLATTQSLYNRIDAVQRPNGEKLLLLNGREYFNPTDLEAFNRYIAGIPSALMPGGKVLIVGTGSLSSVYHASRSASSVESVEIDEQVVALTKDLFRDYNHLETVNNWTLHIDDAKHFLGSTDKRYDLIAIDMVPPVYVQTALLFGQEFFQQAKERLTPRGVLSIYTGAWFSEADLKRNLYSPVKTIDMVFPEYLVVNSKGAGMAFVYASNHLPFGKEELTALLEASDQGRQQIFDASEARPLIAGNRASSMEDLGIVLEWAPTGYRDFLSLLGGRGAP